MSATILYKSIADGAIVSATNTTAGLGASNLKSEFISEICRVSGLSTQIDITTSSPKKARQVFLAGLGDTGLSGFSIFTVKASDTSLGPSDKLNWSKDDSGAVYGFDSIYKQAFCDFGEEISAQYWRINLTATGASNLEVGRLMLGPILGVSQNIAYPLSISTQDRSRRLDTYAPEPIVLKRSKIRTATFSWGDGITRADLYDTISRDLVEANGVSGQVAFIPDSEDVSLGIQQAIFGRLSSLGDAVFSGFEQYGIQFSITEERRE